MRITSAAIRPSAKKAADARTASHRLLRVRIESTQQKTATSRSRGHSRTKAVRNRSATAVAFRAGNWRRARSRTASTLGRPRSDSQKPWGARFSTETVSGSQSDSRGTPTAASCRATCRPMAPTPITTAWALARRGGGISSRCRLSRRLPSEEVMGFSARGIRVSFALERFAFDEGVGALPVGEFFGEAFGIAGPGEPVDGRMDVRVAARPGREGQPGRDAAGAAQDGDDGPVAGPEGAGEGGLVGAGRLDRGSRVGVQPDPAEAGRLDAVVDHPV